jgi:cyanate lyase
VDLDEVAAEIRAELARREMKWRELAALLGHSDAWVTRRLRRRATYSVDLQLHEIASIADVLRVDPGLFIRELRSDT